MKKKTFIVVLIVLALLSLNFCVAQEIDNSTSDNVASQDDTVYKLSDTNGSVLKATTSKTQIEVKSNTTFDVIGDYFKVKLSDEKGTALKNTKVTFTVSGKTYSKTTDSSGIASLQLRLNDGTYKITTKFAGNSNYKASSLTSTVTMSNTRVVDAGLSNSEIQKIIDNAKVNNVILFKGTSYSNVNLIITKSVTLQSNVGTTLKSSSSSPVITIKGSKASLTMVKGFNIQGNGIGIKIDSSDYVKIISNTISSNGNGIEAIKTKYLNLTSNKIIDTSNIGITVADSSYVYIFSNIINNNKKGGIAIAKINNVYIHGNTISNNQESGIILTNKINGIDYKKGVGNVYINKNIISLNKNNGILVNNAENNININNNYILCNHGNGIALNKIGNNIIQSNEITNNAGNGIIFLSDYYRPNNQKISYNAIFSNNGREIEAKNTGYQTDNRLEIEDNWFSDYNTLCPKIKANKIRFEVKQIGTNQFQALFIDSNDEVASLLPDRTLTLTTSDGNSITLTLSGGIATFNFDANNGDILKATVDDSDRNVVYDESIQSTSHPINGKTPSYSYPSIPYYQIYDKMLGGNGDNVGEGDNGESLSRKGTSIGGNSSQNKASDISNDINMPLNDMLQDYEGTSSSSQSGDASMHTENSNKQSVVKQIIIDEDELFRVTGMSFIVLLIILTVGYYYRDDIKEMNSKR